MKPTYKSIALVSLISLSLILSVPLLADPAPSGPGSDPTQGGTGGQSVGGSSGVPVDGGLIEIVIAGAVMGAFAARRQTPKS